MKNVWKALGLFAAKKPYRYAMHLVRSDVRYLFATDGFAILRIDPASAIPEGLYDAKTALPVVDGGIFPPMRILDGFEKDYRSAPDAPLAFALQPKFLARIANAAKLLKAGSLVCRLPRVKGAPLFCNAPLRIELQGCEAAKSAVVWQMPIPHPDLKPDPAGAFFPWGQDAGVRGF